MLVPKTVKVSPPPIICLVEVSSAIVHPAVDVAIPIVSFIASTKLVALIAPDKFAISPKSSIDKALNVVLNVSNVSVFAIVLNVAAGLGAFIFGFLDDKIGGKNMVQISNIALIISCVIAVLAQTKGLFWVSGIILGIFAGPNQAASRSLMGRLIPKNKENEFYGFFAFSGKATAFLGPLLFTVVITYTDSMRISLLMLAFLFLIGMILLKKLKDPQIN